MKSYYTHLKSSMEFGENKETTIKPILRSSAVFPVIHNQHYSSSIHFLGYWLLKRNIPEVTFMMTLRDQSGKILLKKVEIINEAKAFSINLSSLLKEINFDSETYFIGSIETEFTTMRNMVFPYPALVLQYSNKEFNTCVHTLGRIYNDSDDLNQNEEFKVPETGFDIHETDDLHSFVSFVNGPIHNKDGHIEYVLTNAKSEKRKGDFHLGEILPYETKLFYFRDYIPDLSEILDNDFGSISLKHNFEGFYPRLLVGNIQDSLPSVSFTHSYYDCTSCTNELDFWNRTSHDHYDSSVYVPIIRQNNQYTNLIIYPNFSPSDFTLKIDIYDDNGNRVYENSDFLDIEKHNLKLLKINFNKILSSLNLSENDNFSAHVITNFKNNKIPTRIKFGLNVGVTGLRSKLPCNICFNTHIGNTLLEGKPGSFHWAPIFHDRKTIISVGNFSTLRDYQKGANIELNFYRIEDSSKLTKKISLKPNSQKLITSNDDELNNFIKTEGWVTIKADNPYIQGFYFNFNPSGSVSGDHIF